MMQGFILQAIGTALFLGALAFSSVAGFIVGKDIKTPADRLSKQARNSLAFGLVLVALCAIPAMLLLVMA